MYVREDIYICSIRMLTNHACMSVNVYVLYVNMYVCMLSLPEFAFVFHFPQLGASATVLAALSPSTTQIKFIHIRNYLYVCVYVRVYICM